MKRGQPIKISDTGTDAARPLISIVVPCYNEEGNVDRTYAELKRVTDALDAYRFEFIFTDNHSTDATFAKLSAIAASDPTVRIARFSRNFGFQRSVLTGYLVCEGEAAIQIDADLQDPPSTFQAFLERWRDGADVVVGVRRHREEPQLLQKGRRAYYRLLQRLDGSHLIPDAGDFRLIDRSVIERLRKINEPHMYLRGLISSLARNQVGVPVDRAARLHGESKFKLRGLVKLAAGGIMAHSSMPLRVAFYIGIIIATLSMLLSLFYIVLRGLAPSSSPPGFTTTQLLILFGIGLNSMFLGILGVYVGMIYDHIRQRPLTIISDLVNFAESPHAIEARIFKML